MWQIYFAKIEPFIFFHTVCISLNAFKCKQETMLNFKNLIIPSKFPQQWTPVDLYIHFMYSGFHCRRHFAE